MNDRTIAALFVATGGVYCGLPGVDSWDEPRDARLYQGPHPVVAHPPCSRWCRLAGLNEARWGFMKGQDGGCFASALRAVRTYGGVLEHPAYSDAWKAHDLPRPVPGGGWQHGICGGASCQVEQVRYGHPARKATWLYSFGCELPSLKWGVSEAGAGTALVSACRNATRDDDDRPRVMKKEAARTPLEFRDVLLEIARSVVQENMSR